MTLFVTRLLLYLTAASYPFFHPSVLVPYDRLSIVLLFFLVPVEAAIAFFIPPKRRRTAAVLFFLSAAAALLLSGAPASGQNIGRVLLFAACGFITSLVIFRVPFPGIALAIPEQFLFALIPYRLIGFSRSSEMVAEASGTVNQGFLLLLLCAFVIHNIVLYFSAFRTRPAAEKGGEALRMKKELPLPAGILMVLALLFAVILPSDFVENIVVLNLLEDRVEPRFIPHDGDSLADRSGALRSGVEGDGEGARPTQGALEGVPSGRWRDGADGDGGEERQYAVMVVASAADPLYLADHYHGKFDPAAGFLSTPREPLNELSDLRLMETYRDDSTRFDMTRRNADYFVISTLPGRQLAYQPVTVEPTTFDRRRYPFNYSYQAASGLTVSGPAQWRRIRGLSPEDAEKLSPYLEIPLRDEDRAVFMSFLEERVLDREGFYARIDAILRSFYDYQYHAGFGGGISVSHMVSFLTKTKTGDCTEFSNTAAILGRLAGIPSRVVTGYLAASSLQAPSHRQGVRVLRDALPVLQEFPENRLFLVTTAHRHSWVQYHMPGFGWVDFEPTAHAIPPMGFGDPNLRNVVIPLITPGRPAGPDRSIPWRFLGRLIGLLAGALLISAYLFRYSRELVFAYIARGDDGRALSALSRLLLLKLAAEDGEIKPSSMTLLEFAESSFDRAGLPETGSCGKEVKNQAAVRFSLQNFAELHSELRYRGPCREGEHESLWAGLREKYREVLLSARQKGVKAFLRRIFSLKGLGYQW